MPLTPEQIEQARQKYGIQPAATPPASSAIPINRQSIDAELDAAWGIKQPGVVGRVKNALEKTRNETVESLSARGPRIVEAQERMKSGKQGLAQTAFQQVGEFAMGVQDVIGGTSLAAARVFKALSPAASKARPGDPTVGSEFVKSVASLPGMKDDIEALQRVASWWKGLEETNPQAAANYRATAGIALTTLDALGLPHALKAAEDITAKGLLQQGRRAASKATETLFEGGKKTFATRAAKATEKNLQTGINAIAPELTQKELAEAIASGRVKQTISPVTREAVTDFSADKRLADVYEATKDVVNPKATATERANSLRTAISNTSENQVRPFLSAPENQVATNFEDFRNSIKMREPSGALKSDKAARQTYDRVQEELIEDVYTHLNRSGEKGAITDMNEYWDARKIVDERIERELGQTTFDTPQYTGVKAAARDFRQGLTDFIVQNLRSPGQMETVNRMREFLASARSRGIKIANESDAFKLLEEEFGITRQVQDEARAAFFIDNMDRLNKYYEALENVSTKAAKEAGTTGMGRFFKTRPGKAIKKAAPYVGTGVGVKVLGD